MKLKTLSLYLFLLKLNVKMHSCEFIITYCVGGYGVPGGKHGE